MHSISDEDVLARFPDAPIDHDNIEHYRGRLERRLLVNRCRDCGWWRQPPQGLCPVCWSDAVTAAEVSGLGVVHLLTLLHRGPAAEGVDYAQPYPVAVVELDEQPGLRVTATILDRDGGLAIGSPVRLTWFERAGVPVPAFCAP